jgi:SAM-dependent methyltransferase
MSSITEYYKSNEDVNPYTMLGVKDSSRVQLIIELLQEYTVPKGKILDVGCGDMFLSTQLEDREWVGLDVNPTMNKQKCITQDVETTPYPFEPESFDAIVCSEVQEHLFDNVKVTKEIYRLLKPGGVYVVSTPNYNFIDHYLSHFREPIWDVRKSWTKEHIRQFTLESHKQILQASGFSNFQYVGADPHYGEFYKHARIILTNWIKDNTTLAQLPSQVMSDKLLSEMFKDNLHTLIVWSTK